MKQRKVVLVLFLTLAVVCISACKGMIPNEFEVNTSSELGPNTLDRIDDINDTLETGMEIGPETRATIEELNKTIDDGLEFGFTDSTLSRIDILLGMVEQGVGIKAGLDAETNQTVNNLIETLDDQPGQWENTMTEIIHTLEGSSTRVAEEMANEVEGLMVEARVNTQQLSASMGAEFRCNVDFMSTRAGDTLDQFIGRSLVGRLQEIVTGEEMEEEEEGIPIPMVCQMVPDQITLEKMGEEFVFDTAVVRISGYNFVEENKPHAYVVDEAGKPVESVGLYPFLNSPYQIQVNLQDIDFSAVPTRSRVVFEWPQTGSFFAMAMVLPSEEPTPTVVVRPELTINVPELEVRKGPGENYKSVGKAAQGAIYEVTGHNGDQTWWEIDFDNDPGWVPNNKVVRNEEPVGTASSIPLDPPEAAFSMDPQGGKAPLEVRFWDQSSGDPVSRRWKVISEGGSEFPLGAGGEEVSHEFTSSGTYAIKLYVENEWGVDEIQRELVVEEPEEIEIIIAPIKPVSPVLLPTATPQYSRNFIFKTFTGRKQNEWIDTGVSSTDYNCAVVSLAAVHGNIQQKKVGNILTVWLNRGLGNWRVKANVRTHKHDEGGEETWNLGLMCVDASQSKFIDDIFIQPPEAMKVTLNPDYYQIDKNYTCTIAGYDVKNVNVEDDSAGDIIQVYTRKDEEEDEGEEWSTWEVTADYMEEGGAENWSVQMLCFYNNQDKILHQYRGVTFTDGIIKNVGTFSGAFDTGINVQDYACGITGMHAIAGEVKEGGNRDIISVFTWHDNQSWHLYADFTSHHQHEKWKVDLMCIDRSVVDITISDWLGGWIKD